MEPSLFYRPQTKFAKVMFLQVSVILSRGGRRGCSRGVCMVALGGCAWLLWGGMRGCSRGACVVARRGMRGCQGVCMVARGACMVAPRGACVVASGGACMAAQGGMCGCSGEACVVALRGGGMRGFSNEIRSMSGRYASYWNAFL